MNVMGKFFRFVAKVLLWLWKFPQHLCALVYLNKPFDRSDMVVRHYERHGWSYGGAVTLGEYIFTDRDASVDILTHEYGHVVQSRMFGPLYLIVIGLPSMIHAGLHKSVCGDKPYSHFCTEKWADKLGRKYIVRLY